MTTLHFNAGEITEATIGRDGSLTLELTDEAERRLIAAASARHSRVIRNQHREAAKLTKLSTPDLLELASRRTGGPSPAQIAEINSRMKMIWEKLSPAVEALRAVGAFTAA